VPDVPGDEGGAAARVLHDADVEEKLTVIFTWLKGIGDRHR
jgi:uncharacterized protein YjgD (DUF1641 family)